MRLTKSVRPICHSDFFPSSHLCLGVYIYLTPICDIRHLICDGDFSALGEKNRVISEFRCMFTQYWEGWEKICHRKSAAICRKLHTCVRTLTQPGLCYCFSVFSLEEPSLESQLRHCCIFPTTFHLQEYLLWLLDTQTAASFAMARVNSGAADYALDQTVGRNTSHWSHLLNSCCLGNWKQYKDLYQWLQVCCSKSKLVFYVENFKYLNVAFISYKLYLDPGIRLLKTWLQWMCPHPPSFLPNDDRSEGKGLGLGVPLLLAPDTNCWHCLTK